MIGYLSGKLIWADAKNCIISANGVGYEINYFNSLTYSDFGTTIELFVTVRKSEYDENIFGFRSIEEKMLFESIISIKGIGARVVFNIFSEKQITTLEHLRDLRVDDLTKIQGVGKTTAQKFILGIANKIKKELDIKKLTAEGDGKVGIEKEFKGEIDLLIDWGMRKNEVIEFLKENKQSIQGMKSEQIIQFILKSLRK